MARSGPRRRTNRKKWIAITIFMLIIVIVALVQFFKYIHQDEWANEQQVIERANKVVALTHINKIEKSVWESVYYVVSGLDAQNEEQIVWVGPESSSVLPASKVVAKEQIEAQLQQQYNDIEIVRLVRGVKDKQYVWQALVERKDEQQVNRHYYHFFDVKTGHPIGEAYPLPNQ
ncbi:cell wall elongation regulator TseB-like domain-containing protein [Paenibacillus sp. 481]|uniref:cell wall elongation regulator TseB-like domain-containing protein n=1 Tax=Paenibacillus sp. 481 TaxID=2835869 RepID=UPI001E3AF771|nr:DUF5590 domain-containing protein [Paenibacillus sp. 481]UHA73000.1 DUF5590 domain-containing protein [Paenibacillus sp. 481]